MPKVLRFLWAVHLLVIGLIAASRSGSTSIESESKENNRPNILFILVDDLGWGDVGFQRQKFTGDRSNIPNEIQTPNLDRLALQEGMILERHYVHSTCTGTRVSLQSGRLPVHVQTSLKYPEDPASGMPRNMVGMAEHLQEAGYHTHYVGKWDVGMATSKHTPRGRGYDSSLHYFEHKNDFWNQSCMQSTCCDPDEHGFDLVDLWDTDRPAFNLNGTNYEEFIFMDRMKEIIQNHSSHHGSDDNEPLFLFYAPHIAHCPLQVPKDYLDKFDFMEDDDAECQAQTGYIYPPDEDALPPKFSCRKQYHAMVNLLDDLVGSLVHEFKAQGLWDNTLLVFTSDNGGPTIMEESGSTNFDLRGGKYSDWEGGVRAVAFVSGGYLKPHRQGVRIAEMLHITDWYATLVALAGVTDLQERVRQTEDATQNFPPLDALNIWPYLAGEEDHSSRTEIPLSYHSLLQENYKLIWADEVGQAGWTGPIYPNASSTRSDMFWSVNCSEGCLFDVAKDRGEHVNLASQEPLRVQAMKHRLQELREGFFENNDTGIDLCPDDIDIPCACWMAVNYYGGFLGPYQQDTNDESP